MKEETLKEYTILYQYLLLLKEPLYIFLIQIFQHLSHTTWWEDFIEPIIRGETKDNFKYLDLSDLLNAFKMNWDRIWRYLDKDYKKYKYNKEYKMVNKVHQIRNNVAHANDIDMSPFIFADSLSYLLKFAQFIGADGNLVIKLENDWRKYCTALPEEKTKPSKEKVIKEKILFEIENKVLLKAVSSETLPPDIKLSVDRTTLRLHSMRTLDEIMGFFNNAMRSERGIVVEDTLHKNGLLAFEDIKDEINRIYTNPQE